MLLHKLMNRWNLLCQELRYYWYNSEKNISIGEGTIIERGAIISLQYGGSVKIGDNCILYRNSSIITHGGNIEIGNNCTVNPYTIIYGQGGGKIGDNVRIAGSSTIVPSNHIFSDISVPIYKQGLSMKGIEIGNDVWIGSGVRILDGVKISDGCVVGANSVVTKSTIKNGVYVGIPARLLKIRE